MSYDEHLISMAGGDGEADVLGEIEAHKESLNRAHRMSCSDPSDPSRKTTYSDSAAAITYLLAMVREQAAKLDALNYRVEKADIHGNHSLAVYEVRAILEGKS